MILEELKKIKSFGSHMESSVTPEDIAEKGKRGTSHARTRAVCGA